jgi:hypothetical protein
MCIYSWPYGCWGRTLIVKNCLPIKAHAVNPFWII